MKRTLFAIALAGLLVTSCGTDDDPEPITYETIQELLEKTVSSRKIPGLIAGIVDENGLKQVDAAGVRKKGTSDKLSIHDKIHLGSNTKSMTGVLLATLVQEGILAWDTTFAEVFPELRSEIHPIYHDVTLHELVTHRAGLPRDIKDLLAYENLEIKAARIAQIKDNLSERGSGERGQFSYSNLGYIMAGSMAEKVTGSPWEELMKARIFKPLGMESAGFGVPGSIGQTDQPWGHYKPEKKWRAIQHDNPEVMGPGATVHASFADWAKYLAIFLSESNQTLLDQDQLDFLAHPIGDYAVGWSIVDRSWAQGKAYFHSGSNTMWYAIVWVAPEINRAYIAATNSYDKESAGMLDGIVVELLHTDQQQ